MSPRTSAHSDFKIIHENVAAPYTPFHRATYGLARADYLAILKTTPDSMLVMKKLTTEASA